VTSAILLQHTRDLQPNTLEAKLKTKREEAMHRKDVNINLRRLEAPQSAAPVTVWHFFAQTKQLLENDLIAGDEGIWGAAAPTSW
jgi:hypothetical protein